MKCKEREHELNAMNGLLKKKMDLASSWLACKEHNYTSRQKLRRTSRIFTVCVFEAWLFEPQKLVFIYLIPALIWWWALIEVRAVMHHLNILCIGFALWAVFSPTPGQTAQSDTFIKCQHSAITEPRFGITRAGTCTTLTRLRLTFFTLYCPLCLLHRNTIWIRPQNPGAP